MEKVIGFLKAKGFKYTELADGLGYAFETESFDCMVKITGPLEYRLQGANKRDVSEWFSCSDLPSQNHVIDKIKEHAIEEDVK